MRVRGGIGRRYAAALADVVMARGEARRVQEELSAWALMLQDSTELQEVFRNPTIAYEQKQRVLQDLITHTKILPTTANLLQVLLQNRRLTDLSEINERFAQELDQRSGVVSAQVTTARPISESAQQNLQAQLMKVTGKDMRLQFTVDEALIGGVVTRIGSTVYDGSVRTQLQEIKEKLAGTH